MIRYKSKYYIIQFIELYEWNDGSVPTNVSYRVSDLDFILKKN